jgi:hypothetical protein
MKLQELAVANPTKQAAKVFESYFGNRIKFDTITKAQAQTLLARIRSLVVEHRRTPEFHYSEQNPDYLKLIVMEQALAMRVAEDDVETPDTPADQQKRKELMVAQQQQKKTQGLNAIKDKQAEIAQIQKQMNDPTMAAVSEHRLQRRLREASEVQQAQVVLASQDMVDQVQKMIEQVTSMQFKDLPALVDQIKNEVGIDQSGQFNNDANAALGGLVQNLQGAKQQLEAALGVVTGQSPQVPGEELGAEMPAPTEEVPAELPAPEADVDAEMDANLGAPQTSLGRGRR